jgi:regulator of protease activity HflC (stomatin/prohibitin superfamily)
MAPGTMYVFFCIVGLGLLCLFLVLASSIRIVPENIRLSVFRFGRYIGDLGPGLIFLMPFGIDRVVRVDVSDQAQRALAQTEIRGVIGETQTPVHTDGHVEVSGQIWSAISRDPLPVGTKVRVVKVILEVEKLPA